MKELSTSVQPASDSTYSKVIITPANRDIVSQILAPRDTASLQHRERDLKMPHDFMTSLLGGGAGKPCPEAYSPRDPYSWLDDSPEKDESGNINPYTSKHFVPSDRKAVSPTSSINLTNNNGKRSLKGHASTACDEPDQKRMRVKHGYGSTPTSGLDRTPYHQRFLGSPPPMHSSPDTQHQRSSDSLSSANVSKQMHACRSDRSKTAQGSSNNSWPSSSRSIPMYPAQDDFNGLSPLRQQSSPPRAKGENKHDCNRSAQNRKPPISGPFEIGDDDSSDNERASKPIQRIRTPSTSPTPSAERKQFQPRSQIATSQRERQLLESRKQRQEAAQRKRERPFPRRGTDDEIHAKERQNDEMVIEYFFPSAGCGGAQDFRVKKDDSSLFRSSTRHTSPAKDSVVDLTKDNGTDLQIRARPDEKTQRALGQGRIQKPPSVGEEYRRSNELIEARSRKNSELQARVHALDKEDKEHAEARRSAEAKEEVESNELQPARSRMQEEYDQQVIAQSEMARRSRAKMEAQNRLEAQQEAEAERKGLEKRQSEQRDWDEKKRIKDEHREALLKHQAEVDKEQRRLDDQQSALARLSAMCPSQLPPKTSPQDEQKSETDANKILSKHTTPAGLHFKRDNGSTAADAARARVKEIQDRNAQGGLLQTKLSSVSESLRREERIRAIEERDKRLREAEAAADKDEDKDLRRNDQCQTPKHPTSPGHETEKRDSRVPTTAPTPLALPKGPQALISAAGQALLAHANAEPAKTTERALTDKHGGDNYGRQLGEIMPEDIQLVKWRDRGVHYQDIKVLWKGQFGSSRAISTLNKRYRQVKEALESADIGQNLLDLVANGSENARNEVNRAVHGRWPVSDGPKRDARGHFIPKHKRSSSGEVRSAPAATTGPRSRLLSPNLTNSFASSTTGATTTAEEAEPRPHVGGKKLNEQAYLHYLEHIRELDAEDEPETPQPREQSPMCKDDYYHFAYQVQRREISQQDLDDGFVINEDDQWKVCNEPLDNLSAANSKAAEEAACLPKEWECERDSDLEFEISSRNLKDGRKMFKTTWHDIGEVQVRVARYTRYHQDNVRPTSKDGWAPKTIYFVRVRKVEKTGDDVFSESKETDVTRSVDNAVYTTLEEANAVAIRHFVSIAFESKSANLTQRDMEVNEIVKRLEGELAQEDTNEGKDGEQEEGPCFRKEIEGDKGRRRLEVWVEEGRLKGPRNL